MAGLTIMNPLEYTKWSFPILTSSSTTIQAFIIMFSIFLITRFKSSSSKKTTPKGSSFSKHPLPPGPSPWPIIGCIPQMLKQKPVFRWIHTLMNDMNTNIACIRLGNTHVIPISCPKIAKEVLKNQDTLFASRPVSFAAHTYSSGYVTAVISPFGDQWKKMRKVLTSEIICPSRHRWLASRRDEEADNLVTYIFNQYKSSKNVDLRIATRYYCGSVTRRLLFNKRYFGDITTMPDAGPTVDEIEHVEALFTALGYLYAFCISDYFPGLIGLDLDGHEKIVKEASKKIEGFHDPIVYERIQQWRNPNIEGKGGEKKEVDDFLDILITLKDSNGNDLLTTDEIRAQTREIMMAAVDNPSNVVEWIIAELINNPKILKKAVEELDKVVGKERLVQESDIPQLNYIKAIIREGFRLHPVAPFNVPHVALTDTTVAGYFIPKDSHVMLSRIGLGRNPNIWDEPLEFKPERHLNECTDVTLTEHELRFISFSTGRRGCIAATLGTCMTTMLLARLLQGFEWSTPSGSPSSFVDLTESECDLFLAKPLTVWAEPRLGLNLYPNIAN